MRKNYLLWAAALAAGASAMCGCSREDGAGAFAQGEAAFKAGDYRAATRYLERVAVQQPTNADALVYIARSRLALGELASAREWIASAREQAGGDIDVRLLSAQIAWHAKDYASAAACFGAIANDAKLSVETRAEGWSGLGIVEMTRNNRDAARVAFLRAIRLDRRNAAAWYHLGLLYRDGFGYAEAALEQFNIFVRLDQASSPRVTKVQRTIVPDLKESIQAAAANLRGVSKRDSAAASALLAKADAAWAKGNFKTARQTYIDALRNDPLSYPAAIGVAKSWLKTDATKKGLGGAYEAYKVACALRPSAVSTLLVTADLAGRLGYNAQAADIYSRALAADPSSISAIDGLIRSLSRVGRRNNEAQVYQSYRDAIATARSANRAANKKR